MTHTKKSATLQSAGIYLILTISNSVMAQNIANLIDNYSAKKMLKSAF